MLWFVQEFLNEREYRKGEKLYKSREITKYCRSSNEVVQLKYQNMKTSQIDRLGKKHQLRTISSFSYTKWK